MLAALLAAALLQPACSDPAPAEPEFILPERHERFGIFRDLALFQRPHDAGGPFFLDRFETTRRDWETWLRLQGHLQNGSGRPRHAQVEARRPKTGITLAEARRFARWRFCRLQRLDEWEHVRTSGGTYLFPWGNRWEDIKCNTRDLGLDKTAPVGCFASGVGAGDTFDLVGNVGEWTETVPVPPLIFRGSGNARQSTILYMPGESEVRSTFGLSCWLHPWQPAPTGWLVEASCTDLPRLVVGGDYRTKMILIQREQEERPPYPTLWWWRSRGRARTPISVNDPLPNPELQAPGEYDDLTGLRLAADPEGLLAALLEEPHPPSPNEALILERFLRRPEHRPVLREACGRARERVPEPGPLSDLIRAELGH